MTRDATIRKILIRNCRTVIVLLKRGKVIVSVLKRRLSDAFMNLIVSNSGDRVKSKNLPATIWQQED